MLDPVYSCPDCGQESIESESARCPICHWDVALHGLQPVTCSERYPSRYLHIVFKRQLPPDQREAIVAKNAAEEPHFHGKRSVSITLNSRFDPETRDRLKSAGGVSAAFVVRSDEKLGGLLRTNLLRFVKVHHAVPQEEVDGIRRRVEQALNEIAYQPPQVADGRVVTTVIGPIHPEELQELERVPGVHHVEVTPRTEAPVDLCPDCNERSPAAGERCIACGWLGDPREVVRGLPPATAVPGRYLHVVFREFDTVDPESPSGKQRASIEKLMSSHVTITARHRRETCGRLRDEEGAAMEALQRLDGVHAVFAHDADGAQHRPGLIKAGALAYIKVIYNPPGTCGPMPDELWPRLKAISRGVVRDDGRRAAVDLLRRPTEAEIEEIRRIRRVQGVEVHP